MKNEEQIFNNLLKLLDESTHDLNVMNARIESAVKDLNKGNGISTGEVCEMIFKSIPMIFSSNSNVLNLLMSAVALLEKEKDTHDKGDISQ